MTSLLARSLLMLAVGVTLIALGVLLAPIHLLDNTED